MLYLFPLGDGPAIKGNERDIADQMVEKAPSPLEARVVPKTSADLKDCPASYLCESVQLHAEQQGDILIVKLTFSPLSRNLHPQVHSDEKCGLRNDTLRGCLQTDLNMLADDLLTHQKSDLDRLEGHSYGQ